VRVLRCAIYARYSTDKQNPLSIDDQVRKCREFGQRQGWDVLDGHIYADEAITGASDERTGLQRLERRLAVVKASFADGSSPGLCCRSFSAEYLLSGFLTCGVCASKMVVVSGRGQYGRARYGCPMKHARGICTNDLHMRQDRLEKEVISGLQRQVLRQDVAAYALAEFKR